MKLFCYAYQFIKDKLRGVAVCQLYNFDMVNKNVTIILT